jgi:hypothetical protein
MLSATSVLAEDQATYIARLRANPAEDFSLLVKDKDLSERYILLQTLAQADAMVYFEDHKKLVLMDCTQVGGAHAFKHHLMGADVSAYKGEFWVALLSLAKED